MSGLQIKYFLLKPESKDGNHARASRAALRAYANEIEPTNHELAHDLRMWALACEVQGESRIDSASPEGIGALFKQLAGEEPK